MKSTVALFAGEGKLPLEIARRLTDRGFPPVVYTLGEAEGSLSRFALDLVPLPRLELGQALDDLRRRGLTKVMLAGVVPKTVMYKPALMDEGLKRVLQHIPVRDDHSLIGAVVDAIEAYGISVLSYRDLIIDLMAPSGLVAGREPTKEEAADIDYGREVASVVLPLSFGQTVVVSGRAVVAVEAMEGTDATLLRAGGLIRQGVVVKMMRVDQDERYDLPTVGPGTLRNMTRAGLRCLAVEAHRTIILGPEAFHRFAEAEGMAVVGVRHCLFS